MKIANINKAYLGADLINGIGNQYTLQVDVPVE